MKLFRVPFCKINLTGNYCLDVTNGISAFYGSFTDNIGRMRLIGT